MSLTVRRLLVFSPLVQMIKISKGTITFYSVYKATSSQRGIIVREIIWVGPLTFSYV